MSALQRAGAKSALLRLPLHRSEHKAQLLVHEAATVCAFGNGKVLHEHCSYTFQLSFRPPLADVIKSDNPQRVGFLIHLLTRRVHYKYCSALSNVCKIISQEDSLSSNCLSLTDYTMSKVNLRFVLLAPGSRGDVLPLVAVGAFLQELGHSVAVVCHT
eukprot:6311797-Pyramimonas_sp.AAC.2